MNKGIIILGGGISGIACGYFLGKENAVIYESKPYYGGLCNSFNINGFTFDTAVHLSFTNSREVREIFDKTSYSTHIPNPINYSKGYWLKHPVQNNLFPLPISEKVAAIKDFIARPEQNLNCDNYEKWLYEQLGNYIADSFPIKYTRKYWCQQAKELDTSWVGNRIYRPSIDEVLYGAMSDITPNTYYAKEMRYPKHGGYKSFLMYMVPETNITVNKKAILIDCNHKFVEFEDGSKVYYDNLVSSLPLPKLISILKDVPEEVRYSASKLSATSTALVSVGFKKPEICNNLWFYIYDEDLLPARVYCPNLKSKNNVPQGCSSLQFEIYFTKDKPLTLSSANLLQHITDIIKKLSLANKSEIMFMDYREIDYANVIFFKGMHQHKNIVQKYLTSNNVNYIGRFGQWGYLWSDQSLLSGKRMSEHLLKSSI